MDNWIVRDIRDFIGYKSFCFLNGKMSTKKF